MSSKDKPSRQPIEKKTAVSIIIAVLVPAMFAVVLLIAFKMFWAIPFLVLALVIAAGIVNKARPDFFGSLRRKRLENHKIDLPSDEFRPSTSRRSYMMLVSLSHTGDQQITINSSPFVIGRDPASDYCLSDEYVSGRHLVIDYIPEENICYATDVSSNGTYLNSVRMQNNVRRPLTQGDTLQIAGLLFRVEYVHF